MNDEQLEAALADSLKPVTSARRQAALDAFAFRDLDGALAELIEDQAATALRSDDSATQQLRFAVSGGSVAVDIESTSASTVTVVALCTVEPVYDRCELVDPDAIVLSAGINAGAAVFLDVPARRTVRLEFWRAGQRVAVTSWFSL